MGEFVRGEGDDGAMIVSNAEPISPNDLPGNGSPAAWALYAIAIQNLRLGGGGAVLKGWQYTRLTPVAQPNAPVNQPYDPQLVQPNLQAVIAPGPNGILTRYLSPSQMSYSADALSQRQRTAYNQLAGHSLALDTGQPYEMRSLRVHALYLEVMWLHPLASSPATVIPYVSFFPELQVGQTYSFATFLKVAQREAAKLTLAPAI